MQRLIHSAGFGEQHIDALITQRTPQVGGNLRRQPNRPRHRLDAFHQQVDITPLQLIAQARAE